MLLKTSRILCLKLSNAAGVRRCLSYFHDPRFKSLLAKSTSILANHYEENEQDKFRVGSKTHTLNMVRQLISSMNKIEQDLEELQNMIQMESNEEMIAAAKEEQLQMESELDKNEVHLINLIVPEDEGVHANVMQLEVKCGAGGEESMLFAAELLQMYKLYCQGQGWTFDIVHEANVPDTLIGKAAVRDTCCRVEGDNCYRLLRFEGGVHRVQRIPVTDLNGRIHTSTAVVAVLPQPKDIEIVFKEGDLKIDVMRSSGPGGQHVNKIRSAVMVTHIPSGTIVECQEDRSQLKNRATALQKMSSLLYQEQYDKILEKTQSRRKLQVGGRDRSEKIRTYNFSQDRITDHRLKMSFNRIVPTFQNGLLLHRIIEQLQQLNMRERIETALEDAELQEKTAVN